MTSIVNHQRVFERFNARFPSRYNHSSYHYGSDVFLRNVSASGMKFATRKRLYQDDCVSLEVLLSDGRPPISLHGRVIWVRPKFPELWDVGVEFHQIQLMKLHRIYKIVNPSQ